MSIDVPVGRRQRLCVCGEPVHPGTVMRSWSPPDDAEYEAIVVQAGPVKPAPMHRLLHAVAMTDLGFQHRGNLLTWQYEVGEPVRCAATNEVPPPCARRAPACEYDRQYRLAWERDHLATAGT